MSQVCRRLGGKGGVGGSGWDKSRYSLPGELFSLVRSTLEQRYGWLPVENKEVKAFSA